MKFSILFFSVFSLLLFSCGTSNKYIADDIYVLKPSDLPIGESSADETSYAAFKQRKDGSTRTDRQLYADQYYSMNYRNCLSQPFWYNGCGCSYATWTQHSPYSSQYGAMNFGYGYNPYNNFYYGVPMAGMYYGFGNMYYGAPYGYGNMYYGNNYYGYGNGYGGYGYGGNYYSNHGSNYHNGPRGSVSGYSNPNGRATVAGPVKSVVNNNSTSGQSASSMSTKSTPVRKPISSINTTPITRNNTSNQIVSRNTSSKPQRTYQRSNTPNTNRTYTPSVSRTSGTTPNQRSHSESTIQRSGSYNQGTTNNGGGTTRSTGNTSTPRTNTNTGRRP